MHNRATNKVCSTIRISLFAYQIWDSTVHSGSSFTEFQYFFLHQKFPSYLRFSLILFFLFYSHHYYYYYYPALFIIWRKKVSDLCTNWKLHSVSLRCFSFSFSLIFHFCACVLFSSFIYYVWLMKKINSNAKEKCRYVYIDLNENPTMWKNAHLFLDRLKCGKNVK